MLKNDDSISSKTMISEEVFFADIFGDVSLSAGGLVDQFVGPGDHISHFCQFSISLVSVVLLVNFVVGVGVVGAFVVEGEVVAADGVESSTLHD
jgi:hypothetical protein